MTDSVSLPIGGDVERPVGSGEYTAGASSRWTG